MLHALWCYKCKRWTRAYDFKSLKHYECNSKVGPYMKKTSSN
jgi:hypothetical protein